MTQAAAQRAMAAFQEGNTLAGLGRMREAADSYRRALKAYPDFVEAQSNLGLALHYAGQSQEGVQLLLQAVRRRPEFFDARRNLGLVQKALSRLDEAHDSLAAALALQPGDEAVVLELSNVLVELGRPAEAEPPLREALAGRPDSPLLWLNLGVALRHQERYDEAEACYQQAITQRPDLGLAYANLGALREARGQFDLAIDTYRRALQLEPDNPDRLYGLGNSLFGLGRLAESSACYRRALELHGGHARARTNLARNLLAMRHPQQAAAEYELALQSHPANHQALSGLLMSLEYRSDLTPVEIFNQHLRFDALAPSRPVSHFNRRDPWRRLRIGYVSPDFRHHSVAYFLAHVLEAHDREQVAVYCYSNVLQSDGLTARIKASAERWREVQQLSDDRLAELIRADEIDVLVDLAGHTADNRLLAFAAKPAPLQVTWIGYPDTTGLRTMDYRFSDRWADPAGAEGRHTERLVRLDPGFSAYEPPVWALPVTVRDPAAPLTFGSFNNVSKLTSEGVSTWAAILKRLPDSRLLLKSGQLRDTTVCTELLDEFETRGLERARVEVMPPTANAADHLALYGHVDVALDTFPYNGTTTSCEALWMGVPVVSLAGDRHASRVGLSILSRLGLAELAAAGLDEYVELATALAADAERRRALRASLRDTMRGSPLTDGAMMARSVERAYREMWQEWCRA